MKQIHNYLIENQHTNILFVEVPCRHDLNDFSNTNEDIRKFNRKLSRTTNKYKHTTGKFGSSKGMFHETWISYKKLWEGQNNEKHNKDN
jgi:hypothetical protein